MSDGERSCFGAVDPGAAMVFMAVDIGWYQC